MKLKTIQFNFEGATVNWEFSEVMAPDYLVCVIAPGKIRTFRTTKQPTVNNARKFAES